MSRPIVSDPHRLASALRQGGFKGPLHVAEPLARWTTWRIGGPADLLALPADRDDLLQALTLAREEGLPWRVLGNGSNLLVRDEGVRGLVVRLSKAREPLTIDGRELTAPAGASFPAIARAAAARGLRGLEFGAGIPGTLGGAAVMNAGWHEFELEQSVVAVETVDGDGRCELLDHDACAFRYRGSRLLDEKRRVVVALRLRLEEDDPQRIRERLDHFAESRKQNQPTDQPSCGSVFLKPEGDFAGRLIEAAGLKGRRVGGAEVSSLHANFIINTGGARCRDVLELVGQVETEVYERCDVKLVREFELW